MYNVYIYIVYLYIYIHISAHKWLVFTLREKWPCLFFCLWTEYLCISPYSVQMLENTNQKNSESGHFSLRRDGRNIM